MYIPTDYQKSAFRVGEDNSLKRTRDLPKIQLTRAFQYSIAKWTVMCELLEAGNNVQFCGGSDTCALCGCQEGCDTCPIALYVSDDGCGNTPYYNYCWNESTKKRLRAAQQEEAFLQKVYEWWMQREV